MKHAKAIGVLVSLCLSMPLFATGIERHIEKLFDVGPGGTLYLDSDTGTVDISSHGKHGVTVTVSLSTALSDRKKAQAVLDGFALLSSADGNDVRIDGCLAGFHPSWSKHLEVHYRVTIPREYKLNIRTAGADVHIPDISGRVMVKTSSGAIVMGRIDGEVKARTSGGGIEINSATGNVDLRTSGGGIHMGQVGGDVNARTSGGDISVDVVRGNLRATTAGGSLHFGKVSGTLTGRTSGGSIDAALSGQVSKPVDLYTSGGNIKLAVPVDFHADLSAATEGGHVYTDLPVSARENISSTSINGVIKGGGPDVSLITMGGNIDIIRKVD